MTNQQEYSGQQVAVLGYGVEGRSSVNFFIQRGAMVEVHDAKPIDQLGEQAMLDQQRGVVFKTADQSFTDLNHADVIIRSPTVRPDGPELTGVQPGKITSQTRLFLERWHQQSIGVTGTKGKGTTSSLLAHILRADGRTVALGGNIGVPLLDLWESMTAETIAVLELSSYQLWDVTVSPHRAIALMIVPEHLDVHGSLDSYLAAKRRLIQFQTGDDMAILNADYPHTLAMAQATAASIYYVSRGDLGPGAHIEDDAVLLEVDGTSITVAALSDTTLRGAHNLENIAAATLMSFLMGVTPAVIKSALPSYRPLPHRLELVGRVGQVAFYDDSIATTPETAVAGLHSFAEPLVMIAGGRNKDADWQEFARQVSLATNVRGLVLLGEESANIAEALQATGAASSIQSGATTMAEAVQQAYQLSDGQGVVLLSPGAKSFDMFNSYQDRGDQFRTAVALLPGFAEVGR